MKLTARGWRVLGILGIILLLGLYQWTDNLRNNCIDEKTANALATSFLYGEAEEVENAIDAIYNNGGWIELKDIYNDPEVIFPCVNESPKEI